MWVTGRVNGSPQEIEAWALSLGAVAGLAGGAYVVETLYFSTAAVNWGVAAPTVVVLGKDFGENDPASYFQVANLKMGATYFRLEANVWDSLSPGMRWTVNQTFIRLMARSGYTLRLLQNPDDPYQATYTFGKEVALLRSLGYTFVKNAGGWWDAVKVNTLK